MNVCLVFPVMCLKWWGLHSWQRPSTACQFGNKSLRTVNTTPVISFHSLTLSCCLRQNLITVLLFSARKWASIIRTCVNIKSMQVNSRKRYTCSPLLDTNKNPSLPRTNAHHLYSHLFLPVRPAMRHTIRPLRSSPTSLCMCHACHCLQLWQPVQLRSAHLTAITTFLCLASWLVAEMSARNSVWQLLVVRGVCRLCRAQRADCYWV